MYSHIARPHPPPHPWRRRWTRTRRRGSTRRKWLKLQPRFDRLRRPLWEMSRRPQVPVAGWLFCRTSSGVRLCWELEEPQGPKGRHLETARHTPGWRLPSTFLTGVGAPPQ
ncbi:hypothetical protein T484DRAFT_3141887 [Baffinella frigidus]|nr:hypothetical protein T484DRAFT_3141887 [Cryptophyta sp. CCMP2293]